VTMTGNGTVGPCGNGAKITGISTSVADDGFATVKISGFAVLPYTGTAPALGYVGISANGSGGVKADAANGREHLVVEVDLAAKTVGLFI